MPISISLTPDPIDILSAQLVRRLRRSTTSIPLIRYYNPTTPRTRVEIRANEYAIKKSEKAAKKARETTVLSEIDTEEATRDTSKATIAAKRIIIDGKPIYIS